VRDGRYSFRIAGQTGGSAQRTSGVARGGLTVAIRGYIFPVRGTHDFGSAGSRFGAPRAGHTHQGQDVAAACGTPLVAARAGQVRYAGYESSAGYYIVLDSRGSGRDTVYMHLQRPARFKTGEKVRTGQRIGEVGETGDATGCHLHFEIWTAPGWYVGGAPIDPLPSLRRWDAYS
jgi:murein DD-endopeptidase MepM/ murein hydrolase activator NlpD